MFKKQETKAPNYESVETLLGKNFLVEGNIESSNSIRIDGSVKGEVKVQGDIVIGETAVIEGILRADNVHMAGKLKGNVYIEGQLKLTATAKLMGDIEVNKFIIDEGAVFQGNCIMKECVEETSTQKD